MHEAPFQLREIGKEAERKQIYISLNFDALMQKY
jgi:hypothetical protein